MASSNDGTSAAAAAVAGAAAPSTIGRLFSASAAAVTLLESTGRAHKGCCLGVRLDHESPPNCWGMLGFLLCSRLW